jgi:PAS domain S-box-containing protein
MKKDKSLSPGAANLRRQAEARLKADKPKGTLFRAGADSQRLVHELQVHQVELELQNEELRQTQYDLEQSLAKYTDLYDFAPTGYFTLDCRGTIREANLASAVMLGLERSRLIRKRLEGFFAAESRPGFRAFLEKVLADAPNSSYEAVLAVSGTPPRCVQLEGTCKDSVDGRLCRIAATDITARKTSEDALKKSQEELKRLHRQVQNTQENERNRISYQLQEEIGQDLAVLKIHLSWLRKRCSSKSTLFIEKLAGMDRVLNTLLHSLRNLSSELRPAVLDALGLVAAFEWYVQDFEGRSKIECELHIEPEEIHVDKALAVDLFRILQEALTNVRQYSRATKVKLVLRTVEGLLELQLSENGRAVPKGKIPQPLAFSLMGIRERLQAHGGTFSIQRLPGAGTTVIATIPIQ